MPLPPMAPLPSLLAPLPPDTVVAYAIPVRDLLGWTTEVLALVLLVGGVALVGALGWLVIRLSRLLERTTAAMEQLAGRVAPLLEEATATVADARHTLSAVRADIETLSAAAAALWEDLHQVSSRAGARLTRLDASLELLQGEFERSIRSTVRTLRAVRQGARLLGALMGARLRRRRARRPARRDGDGGEG